MLSSELGLLVIWKPNRSLPFTVLQCIKLAKNLSLAVILSSIRSTFDRWDKECIQAFALYLGHAIARVEAFRLQDEKHRDREENLEKEIIRIKEAVKEVKGKKPILTRAFRSVLVFW